jgi:hypothetical protein
MPIGVPNCVKRWSLAALVAWHAIAAPGRAEDLLDVPAACGSQAELERGVAELLGAQAGAARPAVALRREGDEYVLRVRLEDGQRTLRDRDCRALFRAAVLIAALGREALFGLEKEVAVSVAETVAVAGTGTVAGTGSATGSGSGPATDTATATVTDTATATRNRPRPRELRLGALLNAALAYGVVPDFTLALAAGVYLEHGWLGARLVASYQLPQSHHEGDEGVRSDALGASATLELLATRWLKAGLGGDFYVMHAHGLGDVPAARSDWATLATLHAALGARLYGRGRWAFEALARGLFAPQPARFEIRGASAVFTTSRFGFQLGIAWGWRFL